MFPNPSTAAAAGLGWILADGWEGREMGTSLLAQSVEPPALLGMFLCPGDLLNRDIPNFNLTLPMSPHPLWAHQEGDAVWTRNY